jgi:ligand-binding sensor domain-containing protein
MRATIHGFVLALATTLVGPAPRIVGQLSDPGDVTCLAADSAGLWVGTLGAGMLRLATPESTARPQNAGLPGHRVRGCGLSDAGLWVATDSGLARRTSGRFVVEGSGRYVALATAGALVVSGRGDGRLEVRRDGALTTHGLDFVPTAVATDGRRWAAASYAGDVRLGGQRHALSSPIESLRFEAGALVAGAADGRDYTLRADRWTHAPRPPVALMGARRVRGQLSWAGERWFATDDGLRRGPYRAVVDLGGMPCGDRIAALATFDGALWAGSFDQGVCRYDGKTWTRFSGPDYLPSDMVNDLASDGERLYIATLRGLSVLHRDGQVEQRTQADCRADRNANCPWHTSVTGVAVDPADGAPWVVDTGAAHRLVGPRWGRRYKAAGVSSRKITRVAVRDGRVAIATVDQGLLLSPKGARFTRADDQHGLADNWVMDVAYGDDGSLWAATCTRGLSRLRGGRWTTFTAADGLADDYTLAVQPIGDRTWVGTLRGLTVFDPDGATHTLNTHDGLAGDEVHAFVAWRGHVYAATDGGISVLTH